MVTPLDDLLPLPGSWEDLTFTVALMIAVMAFVKEWVVPGSRAKRTDDALEKLTETIERNTDTIEKMLDVNEELLRRK